MVLAAQAARGVCGGEMSVHERRGQRERGSEREPRAKECPRGSTAAIAGG
jgi:hypothetical protein